MDQDVLRRCYEILAVMHYNPERRYPCSKIFRKILINNRKKVNIESLAKTQFQDRIQARGKQEEKDAGFTSSSEHFNFLDEVFILNTRLDGPEVIEYIKNRYFIYNSLFQKKYPISIEDFVQIASTIISMMTKRVETNKYSFEPYFLKEMEYGDMGFVKIPDRKYISNWTKVNTFSKQDIKDHLSNNKVDIEFFLNNYSFTQIQVQTDPNLRFQEYPIFKIDEHTYILAFPFLLIQCLPQKLEYFLQQIHGYQGLKGKTFEGMALNLFDNVLYKNFRKNVIYDSPNGEIDGIMEFENSCWLIECKSRPPSLKSLRGDYKAIRADIKKTVNKSEVQIERALKNVDKLKIDPIAAKKPGSIIILDGIYPQLNTTSFFSIAPSRLNIPRLIINYFDLKEILSQPDMYFFEEFLEWRTQENMPIMGQDEMDYWIWFSKRSEYGFDLMMQEVLNKAVKNNNRIYYRGW